MASTKTYSGGLGHGGTNGRTFLSGMAPRRCGTAAARTVASTAAASAAATPAVAVVADGPTTVASTPAAAAAAVVAGTATAGAGPVDQDRPCLVTQRPVQVVDREPAGMAAGDVDYIATTGEGENVAFATGHFYSMTTHPRGGVFLQPGFSGAPVWDESRR